MDIQFYFRKMESSEALSKLAKRKLRDQLFKVMGIPAKVRITFMIEGKRQTIHCAIVAKSGSTIHAEASSDNMYSSIDILCQKLLTQVHRKSPKF